MRLAFVFLLTLACLSFVFEPLAADDAERPEENGADNTVDHAKIEEMEKQFAPAPTLLKEIGRLEKKYPQVEKGHPKYRKSGHQFTAYIVARLAGLKKDRAYKLAYFAQFPDAEVEFSATMAFLYFWDLQYRKNIMSVLHSLHGGDHVAVLKRREDLKQLIYDGIRTQSLEDHQVGLIIHALADSYAHVKGDEDRLEAFGYGVGHLFHGHKPDIIAYAPERYKKFACALFQALSTTKDCMPVLEQLFSMIQRLEVSRDDELLKFEVFAHEILDFNDKKYEQDGEAWRNLVDKDVIVKTIGAIEMIISDD